MKNIFILLLALIVLGGVGYVLLNSPSETVVVAPVVETTQKATSTTTHNPVENKPIDTTTTVIGTSVEKNTKVVC